AAFDDDKTKIDTLVSGCRCFHMDYLKEFVANNDIKIAIIAVPGAYAQKATELVIDSGIRGIMNFAPVRLKTPQDVFVENVDITMHLEKVVYFANTYTPESA
ncbi:MAG: redox-sensing transcriptional repressor Rex, partial [Oligoflexia bacterium]|nr:redox-sensing transcriptional repressor Rex [Oligoflexia bacterium]